MKFSVLCALILGVAGNLSNLPAPENVELVLIGFRHGDRNPGRFLEDDPNKGAWGLEGPSMLTNIGKQQAYTFGSQVAGRYAGLMSPNYNVSQYTATSSSAERCQMTMQTFNAGLFPPTDWAVWNTSLNWQPVPVGIDNPLLRMYAVSDCPSQVEGWKEVDDMKTPGAQEILSRDSELIQYVAQQTGFPATLSGMADVADNVHAIKIRKATLPDWVTGNNPFNEDIYEKIHKWAEAPQILCAEYQPCRYMMAGYWLGKMVDILQQKSSGQLEENKMYTYASHNEIVTSLLATMGVDKPNGVYYNGAAVIEYRNDPEPSVRVIYSEPQDEVPTERNSEVLTLPFCDGEEWCPLGKFTEGVQQYIITDYQQTCRYPTCFCVPSIPLDFNSVFEN